MKCVSAVAVRRVVLGCTVLLAPLALRAEDKLIVVYVAGSQVVVNNATNGLDYGYDGVKTDGLKPGSVVTGLKGSGKVVDDASVVSGTVVSIAPPNKAVVKVEGTDKEVVVPDSSKMKAGDKVDLTLVSVRTDGDNRPMNSVKTPTMSGTLAFFQEPNMEEPDSATNLPTYGALGAILLALGCGFAGLRRRALR